MPFQVEPYKTGAVAPEVGKRVVGKLPKERIPVVKKEETRVIFLSSISLSENRLLHRGEGRGKGNTSLPSPNLSLSKTPD